MSSFEYFASWRIGLVKKMIDDIGTRCVLPRGPGASPTLQYSSPIGVVSPLDGLPVAAAHRDFTKNVDADFVLYEWGKPSDRFTVVLHGCVKILVTPTGGLGSDAFPSDCRAMEALGKDVLSGSPFIPCFSAYAAAPARLFVLTAGGLQKYANRHAARVQPQNRSIAPSSPTLHPSPVLKPTAAEHRTRRNSERGDAPRREALMYEDIRHPALEDILPLRSHQRN
jgi:hypothetical protein